MASAGGGEEVDLERMGFKSEELRSSLKDVLV